MFATPFVSWFLVLSLAGFGMRAASAEPPAISPASRLTPEESFAESWDISARFDSGHLMFGRFSISNQGPGDEIAYALGQVVFPDGQVAVFQNGRRKGQWSLTDGRLRIEIGSSLLDFRSPVWRVEINKNRAGQKMHMTLPPGPGRAHTWPSPPSGVRVDLLRNAAPIEGTIWVRGIQDDPISVAGVVTATHTSMDVIETDWIQRRVELHAGDGALAIYLLDVASPGGDSTRWLVVEKAGAVVLQANDFEVEYAGRSHQWAAPYPSPARILIRGPRVSGSIVLGDLLVRQDPLSIAPQPFRWLLSFKMEPDQAWFDAASEFVVDGEAIAATGVVSVFYVNEMD